MSDDEVWLVVVDNEVELYEFDYDDCFEMSDDPDYQYKEYLGEL